MSKRETLLEIKVITDDDCGMYRIGEIDTVPGDAIREYVQRHGEFGYHEVLDFSARMTAAAFGAIQHHRRTKAGHAAETTS